LQDFCPIFQSQFVWERVKLLVNLPRQNRLSRQEPRPALRRPCCTSANSPNSEVFHTSASCCKTLNLRHCTRSHIAHTQKFQQNCALPIDYNIYGLISTFDRNGQIYSCSVSRFLACSCSETHEARSSSSSSLNCDWSLCACKDKSLV
jgi:hypothetical protein